MTKTVGLTLGKFAPLHKGHQYMIEKAIEETDHVIVVMYDAPETTNIPLNMRANWIRQLYPEVEVIEGWGSPSDMGDIPEIKRIQETYILGVLKGRKITHFYSSEFYGDHMSKALGAINREIDRERAVVPVSGTLIRENAFKYRQFITPVVYKDLITNIVFLGAPSTGKTTLAESLAKHFNTVWMPEYGREYWDIHQNNRRLTLEQLAEIAEGHLEREEKCLLEANKYLFTDTNAITTYMFSLYYHGKVHEKLVRMAKDIEDRYDIVFLCDKDIPYDDTFDRSGEANREYFHEEIISDLKSRGIGYTILSGTLDERMKKVCRILYGYEKWD
ncbi:MAG: AAA family ATPase [Bacteroidales bacterium]|nr:AAA family ATPase [Bacteroidales bacterium]